MSGTIILDTFEKVKSLSGTTEPDKVEQLEKMYLVLEASGLSWQEIMEYLDELRESGVTNMFGAAPYIQQEFDVPTKYARALLVYWMSTFGQRHKDEQ